MLTCIKHDHVSTLSPFITSYLKEDQAIVGSSTASQGKLVAGEMQQQLLSRHVMNSVHADTAYG